MHNTHHIDSDIIHIGRYRDAQGRGGMINPPVQHQSTVLFDNYADFKNPPSDHFHYGRYGGDCHRALENIITRLENGVDSVLTSSGMSAVTLAFQAICQSGDHILVIDHCYEPVRHFCDNFLKNFNIDIEYFSPFLTDKEFTNLIRNNTRFIWLETPGSLTFDIVDIDAITTIARQNNIITACDNTWGAGYFCKPFDFNVDISVHAATKYICGHADTMLGAVVSADDNIAKKIKNTHKFLGHAVAPDDVYLGLRGVRTMATRLKQHQQSALEIAQFLQQHPKIKRVMHPAICEHDNQRNYHLWQKYFDGSCGLFGCVLDDYYDEATMAKFCDSLHFFGMGYSWGGIESLITVTAPQSSRHFPTLWAKDGQYLRFHIGLEHIDDLKNDLENALNTLQ